MSAPSGRGNDELPSIKQFHADLAALAAQPKPATIAEARLRLDDAMAEARASMVHARQEATLTEQEREDFTLAAQRGQLGERMTEIGDKVAAGTESWDAVIANRSDASPAFAEFLDAQTRVQMPELKRRIDDADLLR